MGITVVPSAITGQTLSAANWNAQVRDNINGIWVLTTAGDMLFATGASAADRLPLVVGGIMYGATSAPAWLPKPSMPSLFRNTNLGVPDYVAIGSIPGTLHAKGKSFTNSIWSTTSTGYENVSPGLKIDLVTSVTCLIFGWAHGVASKTGGGYDGNLIMALNGTPDSNGDNVRVRTATPTPFSCMFYATGVAAGSNTVRLLFKTASGSDAMNVESAVLHAIAIPE